MSDREVWKEAYEVVGAGIAVAEDFFAEQERQAKALWTIVEELGADGYRPSYTGGIRSLYFKELPEGYRKVGRDNGLVECMPHKGRALGKEVAQRLKDAPSVPRSEVLADKFGWGGRSPMDGYMIYGPTATKLSLPAVRYLLRFPRQLNDGYAPPDTLKLIPMSEYIRAFEDHNAEVAKLKVAA